MAKIRVYVCMWEKIGNRVTNPIGIFADSLESVPGLEWISYHYAEANLTDGTPKNLICIAFVKSEDFTDFDVLEGMVKLPVGNLSDILSVQDRGSVAQTLFKQFDIPKTVFDTAITRKDIIVNLARHINPQFEDMGNVKDEDFE